MAKSFCLAWDEKKPAGPHASVTAPFWRPIPRPSNLALFYVGHARYAVPESLCAYTPSTPHICVEDILFVQHNTTLVMASQLETAFSDTLPNSCPSSYQLSSMTHTTYSLSITPFFCNSHYSRDSLHIVLYSFAGFTPLSYTHKSMILCYSLQSH